MQHLPTYPDLKDQYAVVCGSTQGIGLAIAKQLAAQQVNLLLIARNESKLQALCENFKSQYQITCNYLAVDFSDDQKLKTSLEGYLDQHHEPYTILINNTGGPAGGPASKAGLEEFTHAFTQHLLCNQILVQSLLPTMQGQQSGRIINIISTSVKMPIPGLGVSNTIRGAVANWAKTLAGELGPHGITVNNVLPGATETSRLTQIIENKADKSGKDLTTVAQTMKSSIPLQRFASPDEVAAAVVFLCSSAAAYISGINLPVDGGRTGCL